MSPDKSVGTAMDFALQCLAQDPTLSFPDVRTKALVAGISVPPIVYGRAKLQLGIGAQPKPQAAPHAPLTMAEAGASSDGDGAAMAAEATPADLAPALERPEIVAPRRGGSPVMELAMETLRKNPGTSYADLKAQAASRGMSFAPIVYGRAKALLGLVPMAPRGSKKAARERDAAASRPPAAPRMLRQVESVAASQFAQKMSEVRSLDQLVASVREIESDRRRMREVLQQVYELINEALAE